MASKVPSSHSVTPAGPSVPAALFLSVRQCPAAATPPSPTHRSCFVHLGNTQQVKQSQTAAAHHSSCFQRCVGPLAAHHEHPVVSFLWDSQAVSQHISKQPNATEFTAAEELVDMGSRKQPSVFTVHCQFSQRIPLKHQMTH